MKTSITILAGALALTSFAAAQQPSIYIDLEGLPYATAGGAAPTLAAAAPSAGQWNVVDGDAITALPGMVPPLMDSAGNMIAVTSRSTRPPDSRPFRSPRTMSRPWGTTTRSSTTASTTKGR